MQLRILPILVLLLFTSVSKADRIILMGDSWLGKTYNPLAASSIQRSTGLTTINLSRDGQTSLQFLEKIKSYYTSNRTLLLGKGDTVIVDIGLPDFFNGTSKTIVKRNLNLAFDLLVSRRVKIILSCPADTTSKEDLLDKIWEDKLNSAHVMCSSIEARNPRSVSIVDYQSVLMQKVEFNLALGDPVHLNRAGYDVFNKALANEFLEGNGLALSR